MTATIPLHQADQPSTQLHNIPAETWPTYLDAQADLNAPHRLATGERFVQWGAAGGGLLTKLMPCAAYLWHWALYQQPAGTFLELDLDDFQEQSAQERGKTYCFKHIRNAFEQLVNYGLIEIVKTYRAAKHVWGVIVRQAGRVSNVESSRTIIPKSEPIVPKQGAETPIASYPITNKANTKIKPTQPPVLKRTKERVDQDQGIASKNIALEDREEFKPTALAIDLNECDREAIVEECPPPVAQALVELAHSQLRVKITQPIYKLIVHSTIGIVLNAIAAVKERLESKTAAPVRSKEGLFTTALRRHFTPNRKGQQSKTEEPPQIPSTSKTTAQVSPEQALVSVRPKPLDLSSELTEISVHVKRLGWSVDEVCDFLERHFNQRSRNLLNDDQVYQLLDMIRAL